MRKINHPRKGSEISVEPIRMIEDIRSISKMLTGRDHLLFTMGINNGLRVGDLLKLRVKDVSGMKPGDTLQIREGKTGKQNILAINKTVYKSLNDYLSEFKPEADSFLFESRKGSAAITIATVNHLVKKWTTEINLKGNYGAHSLRKTWGYHQRVNHGVGFEIICRRFNHSSPAVTMRYLGINSKEVEKILMHEIG